MQNFSEIKFESSCFEIVENQESLNSQARQRRTDTKFIFFWKSFRRTIPVGNNRCSGTVALERKTF